MEHFTKFMTEVHLVTFHKVKQINTEYGLEHRNISSTVKQCSTLRNITWYYFVNSVFFYSIIISLRLFFFCETAQIPFIKMHTYR